MDDATRRKTLGDFLQTRRARITPREVCLPLSGRRRTPGLRREEVAQLAGVGLTWYTWLEQGRSINVSDQVLESIARALLLDPHETHYLFTLANPPATRRLAPASAEHVGPALAALLAHQGLYPAFILGRRWDILAWNRSANVLLGDLDRVPRDERNHAWHMFANPMVRQCLCDWEMHAQRLLAEFRVSYGRYIEDPSFGALIERLSAASPEFRSWWPRHDVVGRLDVRKEFHHPAGGRLCFEQTTLLLSDAPDLKLVVKIPVPTTDTLDKLRALLDQEQDPSHVREAAGSMEPDSEFGAY
jgi:hypothetical protein